MRLERSLVTEEDAMTRGRYAAKAANRLTSLENELLPSVSSGWNSAGEPGVSVYLIGQVSDLPVFWLVITALV